MTAFIKPLEVVDDYISNESKFQKPLEQMSARHLKNISIKLWRELNMITYRCGCDSGVISYNLRVWNRAERKYPWKQELRMLSIGDLALVNQLRTEHIGVNWYYHALQHYDYYKKQLQMYGYIKYMMVCARQCCVRNHSGLCDVCETNESVYHLLIDCRKYSISRDLFLIRVKDILELYCINISLENVLFPPTILSWNHRKMILDSLCGFVKKTHRLHIRF